MTIYSSCKRIFLQTQNFFYHEYLLRIFILSRIILLLKTYTKYSSNFILVMQLDTTFVKVSYFLCFSSDKAFMYRIFSNIYKFYYLKETIRYREIFIMSSLILNIDVWLSLGCVQKRLMHADLKKEKEGYLYVCSFSLRSPIL